MNFNIYEQLEIRATPVCLPSAEQLFSGVRQTDNRRYPLTYSVSMQRESSITAILPMTYRGHDETFARHLQCRLKSLGNEINVNTSNNQTQQSVAVEDSKLTEQVANNNNNNEIFYEYSINSPGSPVEEVIENGLSTFITNTNDNLLARSHDSTCDCVTLGGSVNNSHVNNSSSTDDTETSDSSEYYDSENLDFDLTATNSISNGKQEQNTEVPLIETELAELNGDNYCSSLNIPKQLVIDCITTTNEIIKSEVQIIPENSIGNAEEAEEEEEEERPPRVRRCSSLKSGKTPPGTPGQKKIVRFADVLGLDLADIRTYLDEIPKIPTSAYEDLNNVDINITPEALNNTDTQISTLYVKQKPDKILVPLFQQPGGESDFLDRVRERQCCLENACVHDNIMLSIAGTVRVRNIDFNKSVHIRYTLDSWKTFSDLQATYVDNSCDGFSDKFSFLLYCHTMDIGQRIEFAIRYQTAGLQFWDNNAGANYCFQCLPAIHNTSYLPIHSPEEHWGNSSFY